MKKVIAAMLLFIISVLSIINCFAKVNLSKENLQKAYEEYAKEFEGAYTSVSGSIGVNSKKETPVIKVEDKQLVYEQVDSFGEATGKVFNIQYSLGEKPTFSYEEKVTKDTSISDMYYLPEYMETPIIGAVGAAIVQGVLPITADSFENELEAEDKIFKFDSHSFTTINDSSEIIMGAFEDESNQKKFKEGEMDNFEYLEYAINDKVELKDENLDFYTYTFTKTKKSDDEYLLKAEIVLNLDADLSKIIEEKEDKPAENEVKNETNNVVTNENKNTISLLPISNDVNNTTNSVTNNTVNNVVSNEASNVTNENINTEASTNMPYVGSDTVTLKLICVLLVMALISFIQIKRIESKE